MKILKKNKKTFKNLIVVILIIALSVMFFSCSITISSSKKASAETYIKYLLDYNIHTNFKNKYDSYTLFENPSQISIEEADFIEGSNTGIAYDNDVILLNSNSVITNLNLFSASNYIFVFNCDLVENGQLSRNFNIINYVSAGAFTESETLITDFFNYINLTGTLETSFTNLRFLTIYEENEDYNVSYSPVPAFTDYLTASGLVDYVYMLPNSIIITQENTSYYYNTRNVVYVPLQTFYGANYTDELDISAYTLSGPTASPEMRFYNYNTDTIEDYIGVQEDTYSTTRINQEPESEIIINTNEITNLFFIVAIDNMPVYFKYADSNLDGLNDDIITYLNNFSPFVLVNVIEEEPEPGPEPGPEPEPEQQEPTKFGKILGNLVFWTNPVLIVGTFVFSVATSIIFQTNLSDTINNTFSKVINYCVETTQKVIDFVGFVLVGLGQFLSEITDVELLPNVPKIVNKILDYGLIISICASIAIVLYAFFMRDRK